MTESVRFPYRSDDALIVTAATEDGTSIGAGVTVVAGLGSAYRPPADVAMVACTWLTGAGATRDFALPLSPSEAPTVAAGVYRVWYRLSVPPFAPLVRCDVPVVIYGE